MSTKLTIDKIKEISDFVSSETISFPRPQSLHEINMNIKKFGGDKRVPWYTLKDWKVIQR